MRLIPRVALFVALSGCNCYHMPLAEEAAPKGRPRSVQEREDTAVGITTVCFDPATGAHIWGGSGVIVGEKSVLTAYHVVACAGPAMIHVTDRAGLEVLASVERVAPDADIARIDRVDGAWIVEAPVLGARPRIGDVICAVPVVPARGAQCGAVDEYDSLPGDVRHKAVTVPGNSGGGVYDTQGALVGIVTHYRRDGGGAFSSIGNRRWLLDG